MLCSSNSSNINLEKCLNDKPALGTVFDATNVNDAIGQYSNTLKRYTSYTCNNNLLKQFS